MLDPYERWVLFHALRINTRPEHAPIFILNDVIHNLLGVVNEGEAIKMMNKETASLRIAEMYVRENHVEMLIQYADTNATDPSFINMETYELRKVNRLKGEGIAVSGHVVIKREPEEDGSYQLLIEQVPGLGRSNIGPFFRFMIKAVSKDLFQFADETANNSLKNYEPMASLEDEPSVDFSKEIEEGIIDGIELVQSIPKGHGEFDEDNFFVEKVRTVKISVTKKKVAESWWGTINDLKEKAKRKGYTDFKIRYRKKEGKSRTVVMGTTVDDIASSAVTKTELIKSNYPLEQCTDTIDEVFMGEMLKLL
ncbi:hypothetical protein [Thalassolituus oleivorans]|uniref:Uncharacterized protein n=1 Tax=Thalassolituus oleivorans MIL-1 TaxID=1298593 RepID=M5DP60_9GAMM|nr:hypothetical protein [Thalassolituus oleivorans]CCU70927.1 hypothetical protein TOL_0488 [Thalassolituus oleivorans MIL-1]